MTQLQKQQKESDLERESLDVGRRRRLLVVRNLEQVAELREVDDVHLFDAVGQQPFLSQSVALGKERPMGMHTFMSLAATVVRNSPKPS
jgi:hypothetical protein